MLKKILSTITLIGLFVIWPAAISEAKLFIIISPGDICGAGGGSQPPPAPVAFLTFTIPTPGEIGQASGILKAYTANETLIASWNAGSGDNKPANQYVQWDESDNDPWGGPIPYGASPGQWNVRPQGSNPNNPTWYPLDKVSYSGPRFGFYIHGWGTTHGCISLASGTYSNFTNTINSRWPSGAASIPLYVWYPQ